MSITLLRHGATSACISGVLRGRRDDPLTEEGWQQMRAATATHLHPTHPETDAWQTIISSPLIRCAAFARELAQARGLPLHVDDRLSELDFGAWEGRRLDELMQDAEDKETLRRFWENPWQQPPPQGETLTAFESRIRAAWQSLLTQHAGQRVLVITHGGVIRLLLCAARGLPRHQLLQIEVANASLHTLAAHPLPSLCDDE
ncbi:MAG: alpha-ribazole phosphatase family protein [Sterolibacterium sp.]|jgi:alpha-ribazole phosphatase|nr:alpha-ribazole phosphatase family protein [Sterolibacterium sp.]